MAEPTFDPSLDIASLPRATLLDGWDKVRWAHANLHRIWTDAVRARFGDDVAVELAGAAAPLANDAGTTEQFFADLEMMAGVARVSPDTLTFARAVPLDLLPAPLDATLDAGALDSPALALLFNLGSLAYMASTGRWYEAVQQHAGAAAAQSLEKEAWLDRGAAEDDLVIGRDLAGVVGDGVADLLRSFQLAPGEVGLLDVQFDLEDDHGTLTHRGCPAWAGFRDSDPARREHCCLLCVTGMRLSGEMIGSRIQSRPAALPPYRQPVDYDCKWEYWINS